MVVGPTTQRARARSTGGSTERGCASGDFRHTTRHATRRWTRCNRNPSRVAGQWRGRHGPGGGPHRDHGRFQHRAADRRGDSSSLSSGRRRIGIRSDDPGARCLGRKAAQARSLSDDHSAGREGASIETCEGDALAQGRDLAGAHRRCGANVDQWQRARERRRRERRRCGRYWRFWRRRKRSRHRVAQRLARPRFARRPGRSTRQPDRLDDCPSRAALRSPWRHRLAGGARLPASHLRGLLGQGAGLPGAPGHEERLMPCVPC